MRDEIKFILKFYKQNNLPAKNTGYKIIILLAVNEFNYTWSLVNLKHKWTPGVQHYFSRDRDSLSTSN